MDVPLDYEEDYADLQRLLEDGVNCAKNRGDTKGHVRHLALLRHHSLVAGGNRVPRMQASVAVASLLYYRKGGKHNGKE